MAAINIGIFAYNEETGIGAMLRDLAGQSILREDRFSVRVVVLANGCRDRTAAAAQEAALAGQLDQAARDPNWLPALLRRELPRARFGWVPWPFLTDRTTYFLKNGPYTPRKTLMAVVGFGFDGLAFMAAQIRLARGKGAGFW
jgi:hypothetical protein